VCLKQAAALLQVHSCDMMLRDGTGLLLGSCIPEKLSGSYVGEQTRTETATLAPGEGAAEPAAVPAA